MVIISRPILLENVQQSQVLEGQEINAISVDFWRAWKGWGHTHTHTKD
jgi:hypothetical protein